MANHILVNHKALLEFIIFKGIHFINDNKQALNKLLMIFMCNLDQDEHLLNVESLNFLFISLLIQFYHKLVTNFSISIHLDLIKIFKYH